MSRCTESDVLAAETQSLCLGAGAHHNRLPNILPPGCLITRSSPIFSDPLRTDARHGILSDAQPKRRRKGRKSMKRRSGQNGTVVIQAGWYRVRWRQDVEGQEQRQQMNEKITPVVFDKEGNPKPPSPEVRRMAREIVERSGANSKEHFDHVVLGAETFKERAEAWLCEVQCRRYGKYKTSTLPTISGALRKHVSCSRTRAIRLPALRPTTARLCGRSSCPRGRIPTFHRDDTCWLRRSG